MYAQFDPQLVSAVHEQRRDFLAQEYAAARRDAAFVRRQVERVSRWVTRQVTNITSGMNQGGSGTLQPSA